MFNGEIHTPSPAEVRTVLSTDGPEGPLSDELVYTALGMYNDNDYLGIAQTLADLGGIAELAAAKAKLQVIETNDNRELRNLDFKYENYMNQQRSEGVEFIVRHLNADEQDAFYEKYDLEVTMLQAEQKKLGEQ